VLSLFVLLTVVGTAVAHEHHAEDIPEGQTVSSDPIVSGLKRHAGY
jgi:hypothetical protein